jgi:hypothetical protein
MGPYSTLEGNEHCEYISFWKGNLRRNYVLIPDIGPMGNRNGILASEIMKMEAGPVMKSSHNLKAPSISQHISDSVDFEVMSHMAPNEIHPELARDVEGNSETLNFMTSGSL